jgi:hypothetical protein
VSTNLNGPPSRIRSRLGRLTRIQRLLAAVAGLIVTIGAVATAITAILDLHDRFVAPNKVEQVSEPATEAIKVRGVRVIEVVTGSPADHAGVRVGDVITGLRGRRVEDVDDFRHIQKQARTGDIILIELVRKVHENTGGFSVRSRFLRAKLQRIEGSNLLLGLQVKDHRPDIVSYKEPAPPPNRVGILAVLTLLGFFILAVLVFFWTKDEQGGGGDVENGGPS